MRLRVAEVARRNKGWTMLKLAQALELDHQTVMCWNQGRNHPRLPTLMQMCRLLECTVEELVIEDGIQAGEAEPISYVPERRKGHAPQIVTSHGCRMEFV